MRRLAPHTQATDMSRIYFLSVLCDDFATIIRVLVGERNDRGVHRIHVKELEMFVAHLPDLVDTFLAIGVEKRHLKTHR